MKVRKEADIKRAIVQYLRFRGLLGNTFESMPLAAPQIKLEPGQPLKDKYMEFVFLSKDEHQKLVEKFGKDKTSQHRNVGIFKKETSRYIPCQQLSVSDLLGLTREGKFFAIEVKVPGNKPTLYQEKFLETVRSFGCIGIVAYSIDDCMKAGL